MVNRPSTAPPVSTRVVKTVARERGVDPIDLPPLMETIDTEALDALFDHGPGTNRRRSSNCTVQFTYAGMAVHVRDGEVSVCDAT